MEPSDLKISILAGLARFYNDGMREWTAQDIQGLINPRGYANSLSDSEILKMFRELELSGFIKLRLEPNIFLEVLKIT